MRIKYLANCNILIATWLYGFKVKDNRYLINAGRHIDIDVYRA